MIALHKADLMPPSYRGISSGSEGNGLCVYSYRRVEVHT